MSVIKQSDAVVRDDHEQRPLGETLHLGGYRVLVSPTAGRLTHLPPKHFDDGEEWASRGQVLATVDYARRRHEIKSPIEARVVGMLVRDGERVVSGQPVAWIEEAPRPRRPKRSRSFG